MFGIDRIAVHSKKEQMANGITLLDALFQQRNKLFRKIGHTGTCFAFPNMDNTGREIHIVRVQP